MRSSVERRPFSPARYVTAGAALASDVFSDRRPLFSVWTPDVAGWAQAKHQGLFRVTSSLMTEGCFSAGFSQEALRLLIDTGSW